MSVLVVGVNHRSAGFDLLERVAIPADEQTKVLRHLTSMDHVLEAAVLSTCNRVEVYAHVSRFHPALSELLDWFATRGDIDPQVLDSQHYAFHDDRAAAHLFSVASGVDSMIVGERQIAVQVREAAKLARDEGAIGRVLLKLFERALYVSRRVRGETAIGEGASSIVDVGLAEATRHLDGSLTGRTVLLIGAGKIGALTVDRLAEQGAGRVLVRNRTPEKADRLAARVDGETVPEGDLADAVAAADLVVTCVGASSPVIDVEVVRDAMGARDGRPLVLLDLGMPHNIEYACADVAGVSLVDLPRIREVTDRAATGDTIDAARDIVDHEADRFVAWTKALEVDPTIRSLRARAERIRVEELERLANRLDDLDEREREAVDTVTRGIVNTLLHDPSVRLRELADRGGAEHYANALRDLFDLDEDE